MSLHSTPTSHRLPANRWRLGSLALALLAGLLPAATAQAAAPHLLINEFYGRGGSANQPYVNKFVELHNPTEAPIDLSSMSLQYRSATGTSTATGVAVLSGEVAAGAYFVVSMNSNGSVGAALPVVSLETSLAPSGTNGTVFLAKATTAINPDTQADLVVDKLGYGTSNSPEGTASSYTGTNSTPGSLGRTSSDDSNDNSADFAFSAAPTPGQANSGVEPTTTPSPSVTPTPTSPAAPTAIAIIQGTSSESPLTGQRVTTLGVVTAAYPTGGFNGFYLQTPGTGGASDSTPGASDGIFVFGTTAVEIGQCYSVTATVTEYNGLTELTSATVNAAPDCGGDLSGVLPVDLDVLPSTDAEREALEGMLVQPLGTYTITNNYALHQYGQLGITPGDQPLSQATDVVEPGAAAEAYEAANLAKLITLDDGSSWNYLTNSTAKNSPLPYLSQATPLRTGSQVSFDSPVILDYRFQWNYQPIGQVVGPDAAENPITSENDRPSGPPSVAGEVQLAAFNVLNYFTDLGQDEEGCAAYTDRDGTPVSTNNCQVRGAYTPQALAEQQAKLVSAITMSDADIIALMEVENSAGISYLPGQSRDKSLATLVAALNAASDGNWAYVPSPVVTPPSEDVIRTAFLYRTDLVQTLGASLILLDDAFANARYPLAQKFKVRQSGKPFVAIANHFKSKGSGADDGTGQGLSNPSREAQATALSAWANDTFDDDAVFLVGDFNAYSKETPVQLIEDAGFTNVEARYEADPTYQYGGRLGSLDHVFANKKALKLVTGAAVWNINSDESVAMQYSRSNYNVTQFVTSEPFAASDHDPVFVGIGTKPKSEVGPKPKSKRHHRGH